MIIVMSKEIPNSGDKKHFYDDFYFKDIKEKEFLIELCRRISNNLFLLTIHVKS